MDFLPFDFIPDWNKLNLPPSPIPTTRRRQRPVPTKKSTPSVSEDADMQDIGGRDSPVTIDNDESASESVVSIPRKTKRAHTEATSSNSRREHQESPDRPAPAPKRAKTTANIGPPVRRLDLSEYEFEEESKLNTVLIPRAKGVVRSSSSSVGVC